MTECLAVIPARGGSKGIPGKNLVPVAGVPLVARAVAVARDARTVDRVVVSTDDTAIAATAEGAGAEVMARPSDLAGDRASSESALLHVLDTLESAQSYRPELLVFLQATSPLTTPGDIDGTVSTLLQADADAAFTAARSHRFLWRRDGQGLATGVNHDPVVRLPRQQTAPEYVETGAVYAMRTDRFVAEQRRFCGRVVLYEVPASRSLEVDDPLDLDLVRSAERFAGAEADAAALPDPLGGVVMDFDGVLTDDRVWTAQDGRESVACSRGDGLGLERLRRRGLPLLVLSKERNPVVAVRCAKLQIPCQQGIEDKLPALRAWADGQGLRSADLVYVGNDVNDRACLEHVGCPVVPADAHPEIRPYARIVLRAPGGRGAVRELADLIQHHRPAADPPAGK